MMNIDTLVNQIKSVWHAYADVVEVKEGFRHNLVEKQHKYTLYCGLSFPEKKKSLLFGFYNAMAGRSMVLPHGRGFSVARAKSEALNPDYDWITIVCDEEAYEDIFLSMLRDLLQVIQASEEDADGFQLFQLVIDRIVAWQNFLGKSRLLTLTKEQEIGLWGELFVFLKLLEFGLSPYLLCNMWTGPENAPQDFIHFDVAIEVKTNVNQLLKRVKISSLEQLDASQFNALFLVCNILKVDEIEGRTLSSMVSAIRDRLSENDLIHNFQNKLIAYGYIEEYSLYYDTPYSAQEQVLYQVDSMFPVLTPSNVPKEVVSALYTLDLSQCNPSVIFEEIVAKIEGEKNDD
nr:PD-(D/E)XK motif protein [uncultured Sphaerochaeta sp.]